MRTISVLLAAFLCAVCCIGAPSEVRGEALPAEMKEAREFLGTINRLRRTDDVEAAITARIKIGDNIRQHRALMGEALLVRLNPYSDRLQFFYEQDGKRHKAGSEGFWVLTIESDLDGRIAAIRVGAAKK